MVNISQESNREEEIEITKDMEETNGRNREKDKERDKLPFHLSVIQINETKEQKMF